MTFLFYDYLEDLCLDNYFGFQIVFDNIHIYVYAIFSSKNNTLKCFLFLFSSLFFSHFVLFKIGVGCTKVI